MRDCQFSVVEKIGLSEIITCLAGKEVCIYSSDMECCPSYVKRIPKRKWIPNFITEEEFKV